MIGFSHIYDDILARLETFVESATIVRSAMEGEELEASSGGLFPPYVVVTFGGPIESARDRHITNRRMNGLKSWVVATAVAPIDVDALRVKNQVIDALWGYIPTDAGEMILSGGTSQSTSSEQTRPHKYLHTVMFEVNHNLSA